MRKNSAKYPMPCATSVSDCYTLLLGVAIYIFMSATLGSLTLSNPRSQAVLEIVIFG